MFDVHSNGDHGSDNFFDYFLYRHILLDLLYPDNCQPLAVRYIVLEIKRKVWSHVRLTSQVQFLKTSSGPFQKSMNGSSWDRNEILPGGPSRKFSKFWLISHFFPSF